ncbi:response regulator [Cellulomonas aerilata]|uniref:DNA-binding response regulator n=1 Tax=Cellulomonas aerilata TaxID=515326 RepID=A0A512DCQ2_9CELL|nr:response regulator transcription factor [Cellulomonas aerilata]GEO34243.1 DNA-binding response regulator [Cellulomonas aerilata]
MIRVVLVDDHRLVRAGLQSLLDSTDDLQVVGAASDGAEALALVAELTPDIVLMDLSMPGMDGVEATRRITALGLDVQILVLTSFSEGDRVRRTLDAGAVGYLLKDSDPEELLRGVRAVVRGESPLDPRAARAMLQARPVARGEDLTDREREVLELITRGMANKQIARALHISDSTVKAHVGSIFQRIGVTDRTSAALWAERNLRTQR